MAKKIWTNATAVWDTDSNADNPGWVVKVTETNGDEVLSETYAPAPSVYHAPSNANPQRIIRETAKWEGAELR